MTEFINEKISVNLLDARPMSFLWQGRSYTITKIGLHHTSQEGRTLLHIFSVTDGNTFFKLQFDSETLQWRLLYVQPS